MQRGKLTRLIPIALVLIVVIVAIAAMISFGRSIFGGGDDPIATDVSRDALLNSSANRGVRMIVRGPIVADEDFRSYQINVTSSQRNLTTYRGYLEQPIDRSVLDNNIPAYEEFINALDKADLVRGDAFEGEDDNTQGVCATDNVYEFEVYNGSNVVKRLWTSTCRGARGSLEADRRQLVELFHRQIPDSQSLLRDLSI